MKKTYAYKLYCKIRKRMSKAQDSSEITKTDIKLLLKKENPVILEIGSNNGKDTMEFLIWFEKIKLHCFEPDPRQIKLFKKNINNKRCNLYEIALSNKKGEIDLFLSEGTKEKSGGDSSSIKKPKDHLKKFPWIKFDKKIKVKTNTLDNWAEENNIGKIDFIWADVQGAEKELIEGGLKTLNEKTKYFYTEFYNQELYEGQISLKDILKLLPNFQLIKIYGNNALLENTK